ncbi:MAG: sulfatase-like hydrolase/transferase [bacterium]|nr:sulfatase-like hydrolase/transferase [bacterium]
MKINTNFFLKLPQNYEFFIRFFLLNIFIFAFFRIFFIVSFYDQFNALPISEILKSFIIGARFDIFVINYAITPFFIIGSLPFIGLESSKIVQNIYSFLITILFGILYFLHLINIEYFKEYGNHLSFTAIEYLGNSDLIIYMIFKDYPIIQYIFLFIALMILYRFLFKKFVISIFKKEKKQVKLLAQILLFPTFSVLLFLGIRGSISQGTMNWGEAFFSNHNIINQATLNPLFNFSKDIYYAGKNKKNSLVSYYKNPADAIKRTQKITFQTNEKALYPHKYPLMRQTINKGKEKKYNIVILLMEEFIGERVGIIGSNLGLTPHFDKLAKGGLLFDRFYSGGRRTNRGVSCTYTAYFPLVGHSIMVQTEGQQPMSTIGSILKNKGYSTFFINGGDVKFDNMQGFLIPKGIDKIIGQHDFLPKDTINKWGVPDHLVFDRLIQEIDQMAAQEKPFLAYMLSLSNHTPYTLPHSKFTQKKAELSPDASFNTLKYVDYEIGRFFEQIEKKAYFKDTIFIILGDHSKSLHHDLSFDYRKSYVPCLFYAPHILQTPKKVSKFCGQIDIAPTIFAMLNMDIIHNFCGKNMLLPPDPSKDFAFISAGSDLGYLKGNFFYSIALDDKGKLYKFNDFSGRDYAQEYPNIFQEMEKDCLAIEQTAYHLYKQKSIYKKT